MYTIPARFSSKTDTACIAVFANGLMYSGIWKSTIDIYTIFGDKTSLPFHPCLEGLVGEVSQVQGPLGIWRVHPFTTVYCTLALMHYRHVFLFHVASIICCILYKQSCDVSEEGAMYLQTRRTKNLYSYQISTYIHHRTDSPLGGVITSIETKTEYYRLPSLFLVVSCVNED